MQTQQVKDYSHTHAYSTRPQGSWRWQRRFRSAWYRREQGLDGKWRWRHCATVSNRVRRWQVDFATWTPHNQIILSPESDPASPYNRD